ncbi:hypothetical protein [Erwinia sp. QL-Z3]|uniref:hypothetical protein n=1 Tax=Erwinia sp. QL-Z3 TaxID=2547962 RepID=UPI001070BEDF|nr:hypothetical protein [Erwinia sp. QL-Z3]QBR52765.1 hypothetical protein E2F51_23600 [Erwinia sp. QL-Z3]
MIDLKELKEIAYKANEAGQGSPEIVEFRVTATPDVVIAMINQLEAAKQRIAELEAEIARRDAAAGEPVAWQFLGDSGKWTDIYDPAEATRYGYKARGLFTAQPSALPPEYALTVDFNDYHLGWNSCLNAAKELGCKAIKLPVPYVDNPFDGLFYKCSEVVEMLREQGFTVEGE